MGAVVAVVPIFIIVLFIHFILRMAAGTGPARCVTTWMTRLAVVVGPFMIGGESVVERSSREGVGIVAVRTLPGKMIWRWRMARGTVSQACVVEAGIVEVARILMAGAASTCKMVGGGAVAGGTICAANCGMIEAGVFEVAGIGMAGRAGSGKVISWCTVAG